MRSPLCLLILKLNRPSDPNCSSYNLFSNLFFVLYEAKKETEEKKFPKDVLLQTLFLLGTESWSTSNYPKHQGATQCTVSILKRRTPDFQRSVPQTDLWPQHLQHCLGEVDKWADQSCCVLSQSLSSSNWDTGNVVSPTEHIEVHWRRQGQKSHSWKYKGRVLPSC